MPNTGIVKYHVKLKFEVDGIVEKADIIGAIFGQTEGLLGPEMNLNELQKMSKVGRIEVNVDTKSNTTKGDALLPMSTDISTAALISAAIESIDKVGPFQGKFLLVGIDDIRAIKKKVIVDRAKKIIQEWATKTISEGEEMLRDVYDASKPGKLTTFGKAQLACGTGVFDSPYIILVEGRADVINLLRAGFDNSIAIEGAKIDETITNLTSGKKVIAFLDGDRAADLILKELQGLVKIDKVLRAPDGKEVEECTPLEISEILKDVIEPTGEQYDVPARHQKSVKKSKNYENNNTASEASSNFNNDDNAVDDPQIASVIKEVYPQINETLEALILDNSMQVLLKIPVSEIIKRLDSLEGARFLVLDGIITQRLIDAAYRAGIEFVVGHRMAELKKSPEITVRTFDQIGIGN
ncbi:MAG: DNA primase [Thaumarchaeota archaeon]|nr:MAG: DNA primase [Nitrososphaerota archaeon]